MSMEPQNEGLVKMMFPFETGDIFWFKVSIMLIFQVYTPQN